MVADLESSRTRKCLVVSLPIQILDATLNGATEILPPSFGYGRLHAMRPPGHVFTYVRGTPLAVDGSIDHAEHETDVGPHDTLGHLAELGLSLADLATRIHTAPSPGYGQPSDRYQVRKVLI